MRRLPLMLLVTLSLCGIGAAHGASNEPSLRFTDYVKQLKESYSIIFVSYCAMENGGQAVMIFRQTDQGGKYFELSGDHTVRYEQVVLHGGGFEIKVNSGTRYLGKKDQAIRTLIRSYPYFMMPSYELDDVLSVPPDRKCFEHDQ
jgi:hypothetical protein